MSDVKKTLQLVWGVLLFLAGFAMFVTIPGRVQDMQATGMNFFGMKFMFYLISVLLMMGGGKKVYDFSRKARKSDEES
jgi:hypothetical protein